jgi:hypothetical protein
VIRVTSNRNPDAPQIQVKKQRIKNTAPNPADINEEPKTDKRDYDLHSPIQSSFLCRVQYHEITNHIHTARFVAACRRHADAFG